MILLNLVFSLLAIFHLTYLGSMFDPGIDEQEVEEVRAPLGPTPPVYVEDIMTECKFIPSLGLEIKQVTAFIQ